MVAAVGDDTGSAQVPGPGASSDNDRKVNAVCAPGQIGVRDHHPD